MSDTFDLKSPDLVNKNFEKLAAYFLKCVTEGANIDNDSRVFRLDESHIQDVFYKQQVYNQINLDSFADIVKSDLRSSADDLLVQVMLNWGLPLSLIIEQEDISGKKVIVDGSFKNDRAKTKVKQWSLETKMKAI